MLSFLNKIKISKKLPFLIVLMCFVSIAISNTLTVIAADKELVAAAQEKLVALQASRVSALSNYLGSIEEDLTALAKNDYVKQAVQDYMYAWDLIEEQGNPTKILQDL